MRYQASPEPLWNRVAAVAVALAFLSTLARLLLQMPEATPVRRETRIQLRWLAAEGTLPAPLIVAPVPARSAVPVVAARTGPAERPVAVTAPATPPPAPVATAAIPAASWSQRLYGKDGTLAVPEASTARQKSATEQVFEHRDALASGVGERPLEGAVAKMFEDSKKPGESPYAMAARVVHGRDVQPAQARRPPPVAFNPNLHEQKADLGSEATGDAYKAAPIRFEKAPDLKGEASRRIRVAVGDLERRYPRCSAEQRTRWMAPVLAHLDALQRVEYRFNNGADPVEAEHSLPSAADSAYDMARRALWDAERRMKTCS